MKENDCVKLNKKYFGGYAPFEQIKKVSRNPDISLRMAIITQAMVDASARISKRNMHYVISAREWIFGPHAAFVAFCIDCELNYRCIQKITHQQMMCNNLKNGKIFNKVMKRQAAKRKSHYATFKCSQKT